MTEAEATAVLKSHGYVRGQSTTRDIRGEARAQIKQACRVLEDAGHPAPPYRPKLPTPPKKGTPRKAGDVKKRTGRK